jgi:hypothetical protein
MTSEHQYTERAGTSEESRNKVCFVEGSEEEVVPNIAQERNLIHPCRSQFHESPGGALAELEHHMDQ